MNSAVNPVAWDLQPAPATMIESAQLVFLHNRDAQGALDEARDPAFSELCAEFPAVKIWLRPFQAHGVTPTEVAQGTRASMASSGSTAESEAWIDLSSLPSEPRGFTALDERVSEIVSKHTLARMSPLARERIPRLHLPARISAILSSLETNADRHAVGARTPEVSP